VAAGKVLRKAGERRHRVTLQAPSVVEEAAGAGGFTETWADLSPANVWARVIPSQGTNESVAGNVERAAVTHRVELDYHAELTTKCRVVLGDRYLYVRGIANWDERNKTQILTCEERA
jgi:SPP1 family predicted phage head-tail adaptor